MGWLVALLTAAFNAVLNALVRGFSDRAQDADRVSTHERAARAEQAQQALRERARQEAEANAVRDDVRADLAQHPERTMQRDEFTRDD